MAFRADISVDWGSSPRIVTVAAPSTSLDLQDLVDTLRTLEAELDNLDNRYLIDAFGKQQLGPGKYLALTVVLRNALLAFEARSGPTWVSCDVEGGNLLALDELGAAVRPFQPTAYVNTYYARSTEASLISGTGSPTDIAAAVWDEIIQTHTTPGSAALILKFIKSASAR